MNLHQAVAGWNEALSVVEGWNNDTCSKMIRLQLVHVAGGSETPLLENRNAVDNDLYQIDSSVCHGLLR